MSYRNAVGVAMFDALEPCARCGVERAQGGNTSVLCRDCRSVLTREELIAWLA